MQPGGFCLDLLRSRKGMGVIILLFLWAGSHAQQDTVFLDGKWEDHFTGDGEISGAPLVKNDSYSKFNGTVVAYAGESEATVFHVEDGLFHGKFRTRAFCDKSPYSVVSGSYDHGLKKGVWYYRFCLRDVLLPKDKVYMIELYDDNGILTEEVEFFKLSIDAPASIKKYKAVRRDDGRWKRVEHGDWKYFSENGNLINSGTYIEGKKHGEWKYFDPFSMNRLEEIQVYDHGVPHGQWLKYCDITGDLKQDFRYENGCKDGYQHEFYCVTVNGKHTHKLVNYEKYASGCLVYREYSYGEDRTIERYKLQNADLGCDEIWPIQEGKWEYFMNDTLVREQEYLDGELISEKNFN